MKEMVKIEDAIKILKSWKIYTYDRNGYIDTAEKMPKESISEFRKALKKVAV